MKKIVLFCGAGMSSSLLVLKIREAAKNIGYECSVNAFDSHSPEKHASDADVVLIGPQIRFVLKDFRAVLTCPVEVIDMVAYGSMNGPKVLAQARKLMNDE